MIQSFKLILFSLCFLAFGAELSAQSAEIRNVRKKEFRGVHSIINKQTDQVEGYYTFYVNEKIGGGQINFVIQIFDADLNLVKQTPVTMSKGSLVESSAYNGEDFFFVFRDIRKKKLSYVTIDKNGEIIKTLGIKERKWAESEAEVHPSNTGGFYIVKPIKEKKWGYSIARVDRNINTIWENRFVPDKGYVFPEAIESGGDRLLVVQIAMATRTSKKARGEIVCFSDKDGSKLYKHSLYDGKSTGIPSSFLIDKGGNIVTGGMYFEGERWRAKNSDGIFFLKLDPSGKEIFYQKEDWDNGIQQVLKSNKRGFVIGSKPKVLFHEIVQSEDGNYQIISETFRITTQIQTGIGNIAKSVSGRYIGDMSRSNEGSTGFRVEDFMIFNYDESGKMVNINQIAKDPTKLSIYSPYTGYFGIKLARLVKEFGFFDYAFTTKLEGSDERVLVSRNKYNKEPYIGVTTINVGEVSKTQKIEISKRIARMRSYREGDFVGAIQSKPGHICIYYYDQKNQTVYLNVDKIEIE